MSKHDPAFARPSGQYGGYEHEPQAGISCREYVATQIMGHLAAINEQQVIDGAALSEIEVGRAAVAYADALFAALEGK